MTVDETGRKLPPGDAPWWAYALISILALQLPSDSSNEPAISGVLGILTDIVQWLMVIGWFIAGIIWGRRAWLVRPGRPARQADRRRG